MVGEALFPILVRLAVTQPHRIDFDESAPTRATLLDRKRAAADFLKVPWPRLCSTLLVLLTSNQSRLSGVHSTSGQHVRFTCNNQWHGVRDATTED